MLSFTTRTDAHGNPISGSEEAVKRYDAALDHLLAYRNEVVDAMTSFVEQDEDFPMGTIFAAYLCLTSTDVPDLPSARELTSRLEGMALNDRERAHRAC